MDVFKCSLSLFLSLTGSSLCAIRPRPWLLILCECDKRRQRTRGKCYKNDLNKKALWILSIHTSGLLSPFTTRALKKGRERFIPLKGLFIVLHGIPFSLLCCAHLQNSSAAKTVRWKPVEHLRWARRRSSPLPLDTDTKVNLPAALRANAITF